MKRTILRMLDEAVAKWPTAPVRAAQDRRRVRRRHLRRGSRARPRVRRVAPVGGVPPGRCRGHHRRGQSAVDHERVRPADGRRAYPFPLSIKLLGEEIPFRLNHSGAKAIFTTKNQLKKVLGCFASVENKAIRWCTSTTTRMPRGRRPPRPASPPTADRLRRGPGLPAAPPWPPCQPRSTGPSRRRPRTTRSPSPTPRVPRATPRASC